MYFGACIDDAGGQLPVAEMDAFPALVLRSFSPFLSVSSRYHPCPARLVLNLIP
jgi:hypothetical protein